MNICVIPARGESKRIPKKNIKNFMGKPIIAYSIEAALQSGLFNHVIVSTDDDEIAEVAKKFGATVPFIRPKELSDDFTGTEAVVQHACHWFTGQQLTPDYICCLYATAPFIECQYIKQGYEQVQVLTQGRITSMTSFAFPIQRALKLDDEMNINAFYPEFIPSRSQDLEDAYHEAGQFYWWSERALMQKTIEHKGLVLPRHLVQDIDSLEDWKQAELIYQAYNLTKVCC